MLRRGSGNCLLIQSKGAIDPQFFWLLGASTKRDSETAIGMFGTGLKYAIPVLMRNDILFEVRIGTGDLVFRTKEVVLNGTPFHQVEAVYEKDGHKEVHPTSLTLTLGKDWEVSHAIREIVSNAIDQEHYEIVEASWHTIDRYVKEGHTSFIIDIDSQEGKQINEKVREYVDALPVNFLVLNKQKGAPLSTGKLSKNRGGEYEIYRIPPNLSKFKRSHVYRRGVYVGSDEGESEHPSEYAYNFSSIKVDELRRSPENEMQSAVASVLKQLPIDLMIEILKKSTDDKSFESESVRINCYDSVKSDLEKELDKYLEQNKMIIVPANIEEHSEKRLKADGYTLVKISDHWYKNAFSKNMMNTFDNLYQKNGKDVLEFESKEYTKDIKSRIGFIVKLLKGNTEMKFSAARIKVMKYGSVRVRLVDKTLFIRDDMVRDYDMKTLATEVLMFIREKEVGHYPWSNHFATKLTEELVVRMLHEKKMALPK